jgi:pimeloyl-ACP methyl ester carboxylesterase
MTTTLVSQISIAGIIAASLFAVLGNPLPAMSDPSALVDAGSKEAQATAKATIVLVHGAFADGSSWQHVIPILERDGYNVIAVQNALASLAGDVENTKRVIDAQTGPMVVVGHSYGGAVITGAAAGNENVKALVYIAAFAPDPGEPIGDLDDKYPTALDAAVKPDAAGYLYIDRAQFRKVFASDVPIAETNVMMVTQKPLNSAVFGESVDKAAWQTIPSWYIVATEDQALNPDQERYYAKRIGAKTIEIKSSHVVFISHPNEVVQVIEDAATTTIK